MLFTLQGTDMMNHNQLSHLYILHAPKKLHPFHNKVRDIKVDNVSQFSSVQLLSHVRLFETPWTAARQASLSITNPKLTQTHVHRVSDAIQPSHPLSAPSPLAFNLSQHQGVFK